MDTNFKQAICADCGAPIMLDASKKNSFCANCGGRISVEESIKKHGEMFPDAPETPGAEQPSAGAAENAPEAEDADPIQSLYNYAQLCLDNHDYGKAADAYNNVLEVLGPKEHAAHWGLFLADERNMNEEEKLLQYFACFPFRQGYEQIKQGVLNNGNFARAYETSREETRSRYNLDARKYADYIYSTFREGCDNLLPIFNRRLESLCQCYESVGLSADMSHVSTPYDVQINHFEEKLYLRFSANSHNMLYLDAYDAATHTVRHYRNLKIMPNNGKFSWTEFREFRNADNPEKITGSFNPYNKQCYHLLAMWENRIIVRSENRAYFMRAAPPPGGVADAFYACYKLVCVPVIKDPDSRIDLPKPSKFYTAQPIRENYDTNRKTLKLRRSVGCFVATAVYGDYDAPQVLSLRRFRDRTLARSAPGRAFIALYYRAGPVLAKFMRSKGGELNPAGRGVRALLDRFVKRLDK